MTSFALLQKRGKCEGRYDIDFFYTNKSRPRSWYETYITYKKIFLQFQSFSKSSIKKRLAIFIFRRSKFTTLNNEKMTFSRADFNNYHMNEIAVNGFRLRL